MNPLYFVFISIFLVTISQLLFKQGVLQIAKQAAPASGWLNRILKMLFQKHIFAGLFLNGLAAASWLLALSKLELSFVFPFLSLNYIIIPLLAILFFREKLSTYRLVGILVICIGIFLIALS